MISSLALMGMTFTSADGSGQSMLNGSYVEIIEGQTYQYTLSSSGSGRYDEFYISVSGAESITADMEFVFDGSYRVESSDDFDLYYQFGNRITDCSSSLCNTYDDVSWASGNSPEQIVVSNPSDGTHHFRVQRYGGYGTEQFYFTVTIVYGGGSGDTTAPSVSVTSPSNGATVSDTIALTASASDNVGVDRVEFYVDGALKGTDYSSPYSVNYDTTTHSNGAATVQAVAYDAAGNSASDSVSVTIDNQVSNPGTCGETPRITGSMPFWNDAIDVEKAHAAGCYGGDTVVVILDTGLGSQYNGLFPSGSINTQYSFSYTQSLGLDNVDWNEDTEGHGTSVTATVLGYTVPSTWGMTNNYVMGVAPNAEIVMLRVVYWIGGSVTESTMLNNWANAINYAVGLHNQGAFGGKGMVISMSLGYSNTNTNLNNAIANAENSGVIVSTSAGNDGPGSGTTGYPANLADTTSVAAAGWSGYTGSYGVAGITANLPEDDFSGLVLADFSSRGKVDITGMGWQLALPTWDNSYQYISGTSFSCPQVSGVYALMMSMYGTSQSVAFFESTMGSGAYWGSTGSGSMTTSAWGQGFVQADGALGL